MRLSIIVAIADNGVIGKSGSGLLWHLRADLQRFKKLTTGHPIIMGRKTFDSLPAALPNRRNIVVTRNPDFRAANTEVAHSLNEAIEKVATENEAFVIGGADLIRQSLPLANKIYLTQAHGSPEGDVKLDINYNEWQEVSREAHKADEQNDYDYEFVELVRQLDKRTSKG